MGRRAVRHAQWPLAAALALIGAAPLVAQESDFQRVAPRELPPVAIDISADATVGAVAASGDEAAAATPGRAAGSVGVGGGVSVGERLRAQAGASLAVMRNPDGTVSPSRAGWNAAMTHTWPAVRFRPRASAAASGDFGGGSGSGAEGWGGAAPLVISDLVLSAGAQAIRDPIVFDASLALAGAPLVTSAGGVRMAAIDLAVTGVVVVVINDLHSLELAVALPGQIHPDLALTPPSVTAALRTSWPRSWLRIGAARGDTPTATVAGGHAWHIESER